MKKTTMGIITKELKRLNREIKECEKYWKIFIEREWENSSKWLIEIHIKEKTKDLLNKIIKSEKREQND